MLFKTQILYIIGFGISLSIFSISGLFSKPINSINQFIVFIIAILMIPLPNFISISREKIYDYAIKGETQKLLTYIEKGGDINKKNSQGKNLLYYAIIKNNSDVIDLLIAHKVDINIKDNEGNTPLHQATRHGNIRTIKLLLENGADVNIKNNKNQTPLSILQTDRTITLPQETKNNIACLLKKYC